ncbi:MAG: pyridoxal-phosphate dependent enzyme [Chloroflexi bacterium]|nr:pyridoxal-phosphate dependent enzyme [Chloroflexota bacterium]MCC6894424.1 pyridoxal-phosphate dependent enzyme [Anaerolineae bacterium]
MTLITLDDIQQARQVIAGKLHRTPLVTATVLGEMLGVKLLFKAELLQKTGSYKPRGAMNKLNSLSAAEKANGVVSMSAGNFAAGLAYAAAQLGVKATIVMPEAAVKAKVAATRGYGATALLHGAGKDLMPKAMELVETEGLTFVHPFDDPMVVAGTGTLGMELVEDGPEPDYVLVPVGGGGLIAGVSTAIKLHYPKAKVIGVEPTGAVKMLTSVQQHKPVAAEYLSTIADGLAAPFAGKHTLEHVEAYVDDIVLVTDDEIKDAMLLIMERSKLFVEPSGAAGFAALLHGKVGVPAGSTVICVLSGGNIDRERLKAIL